MMECTVIRTIMNAHTTSIETENTMHRPHVGVRGFVVALVLGTVLLACGSDADTTEVVPQYESTEGPQVSITRARSPKPAEGSTSTAVYGILANNTDRVIRVVDASSPAAESVALERPSAADRNVLETVEAGFVIDVDGGVVMEPGNFQLTLRGVDAGAFADPIPVTLQLDTGDEFSFQAAAVDPAG